MSLFRVTWGNHQRAWGDGQQSAARDRARELSRAYEHKCYVYWVDRVPAYAPEGEIGVPVSVWVRGTEFQPDSLPRVEVWKGPTVVAMVPVLHGDETWSTQAAFLLKRAHNADTINLARPLVDFVLYVTTHDNPIKLAAQTPASAVMEALQREVSAGRPLGKVCGLSYRDPRNGKIVKGDHLLETIPGTVTGPVLQGGMLCRAW